MLNLLIQGSAAHAFTSASHVVQEQLETVCPGLTRLSDHFAIRGLLNYFDSFDALLWFGRPNRYWGWSNKAHAPFSGCPFLAKYGNLLATESRKNLKRLAKEKTVPDFPMMRSAHLIYLMIRLGEKERGIATELAAIATRACSQIWGITEEKMDGRIVQKPGVAFGNLQPTNSMAEVMQRAGAIGYSGIEKRDGGLVVRAQATIFVILLHELFKGTAELVCAHGLNRLDAQTYFNVVSQADRLHYEPWLLQAGPEMWRRFLAVVPRDLGIPHSLMNVSMMVPEQHERFMFAVLESPENAKRMIQELAR